MSTFVAKDALKEVSTKRFLNPSFIAARSSVDTSNRDCGNAW